MKKSGWNIALWDQLGPVLPSLPGVYAIYCNEMLGYIGSSEDLYARVRTEGHKLRHHGSSGWFVTPWCTTASCIVKYRLSRKDGDWLAIEHRLIKRLEPKFNRRGVNPYPLAKAIARKHRDIDRIPEGERGARIPGSRFVRDFCRRCNDPIRVPTVDDRDGKAIEHYCDECDPGPAGPSILTPRQQAKRC